MMARLIELVQRSPDMSDDHRAALDSLGELTGKRSWSFQLRGTQLSVEGTPVPPEVPLVPELVARMRTHGVVEIHIGFGAAGLDLMLLVKALVADPGEVASVQSLVGQLKRERVRRIWILGEEQARQARESRQMRISEALEASGVIAAESMELPQLETVASSDTAAERVASEESPAEVVERAPLVEPSIVRSAGTRPLGAKMESNQYTGFEIQPTIRSLWSIDERKVIEGRSSIIFWAASPVLAQSHLTVALPRSRSVPGRRKSIP